MEIGVINDGVGIILFKVVIALYYSNTTTNPVWFISYEVRLSIFSRLCKLMVSSADIAYIWKCSGWSFDWSCKCVVLEASTS
jgi:hypothetical protein